MTTLTPKRELPERPALAPWYRVLPDDGRLLIEHGGSMTAFDGKAASLLLPSLLPLLDGSHTVEEIVESLGGAIAPATQYALELLAENGALVDGPQPSRADGPAGEAAIFTAATGSTSPADALSALSRSRVAVAGSSAAGREIARILKGTAADVRAAALEAPPADDREELLIAAPAHEELARLLSLNERHLELGAPWLQVLPYDGRLIAIGPLFVPEASGCHVCYRLRRGACSGFEDDFERVESVPPQVAAPSPLTAVAAGLAGMLALRWLAAADPSLPGRFYTLETGVVLALGYHQLLRVPRCPACGAGDAPMPSPWFGVKARDD